MFTLIETTTNDWLESGAYMAVNSSQNKVLVDEIAKANGIEMIVYDNIVPMNTAWVYIRHNGRLIRESFIL